MTKQLVDETDSVFTEAESTSISNWKERFRSVMYDHTPSGAEVTRITTYSGEMYVRVRGKSGFLLESKGTLPPIHSKEDRDQAIRDMARERLRQEDIAAILGISQGTVSNVLRNKNKKDQG
ncbi:MAG: helix-turn-helix domain-containing protein [Bacteroidales bacterium]|jgi:hypothetical protein|nr:helix-turn-helix domain-containing protein [Bacteroidales bacterium]